MALRAAPKTKSKDPNSIEDSPRVVDQRKPLEQRYRLQVDRQTKQSFETLEAATAAGLTIKTAHPIVQVSVYDAVDCINRIVGLDAPVPAEDSAPA